MGLKPDRIRQVSLTDPTHYLVQQFALVSSVSPRPNHPWQLPSGSDH